MIYFLILLDILINNYTKYTSLFFLLYLYDKPYQYYLLTGLILDLLIFNSLFINTIILSLMFWLNKIFKDLNKKNFYNYIFFLTFNYIIYIFLTNIFMLNNISNILIYIGSNLIINLLFYILSYRLLNYE